MVANPLQGDANQLTIARLLLRQARRPEDTDTARLSSSAKQNLPSKDVIVVEDDIPAAKMTKHAEESCEKVVGAEVMLQVLKRTLLLINM